MGHAVSTCTSSKDRQKSPSEVTRDAHRAQTFYENTRKGNTEHGVRQQNTETDQMCELFHSPARSLTDDEDRRHADMGDSLTDGEDRRHADMGDSLTDEESPRIRVWFVQCRLQSRSNCRYPSNRSRHEQFP